MISILRKKVIIGNWKMNNNLSDSIPFINLLKDRLKDITNVDIAICPSFISLNEVKNELKDSNIKVGAQNVHFEDKGAFTGEISASMLKDISADYCIIGHSERRKYFNETDEIINRKLKKLLEYNIVPIICVGENLEERESGNHFDIVKKEVVQALKDIPENCISNIIIAYEPIWAIGTGKTATDFEAEEMCKYIRDIVKDLHGENVSSNIRIQYGGSVNKENAKELLNMPNIDGALVGGASLKLDFVDIVESVM